MYSQRELADVIEFRILRREIVLNHQVIPVLKNHKSPKRGMGKNSEIVGEAM